ncbi:uncharacterized protein LOC134095595 [Sardina pilchardus]|uniref:uncharacterized protein LOC134095595 n=1 Tax=Sardina pilchardus TaxID=27697 RepID=UPI002E13BC14
MKVVPAVIRPSDSVNLTCVTSRSDVFYCSFCINHPNCTFQHSTSCRSAHSGNDLLKWSGQSGIAVIELTCYYIVQTFSRPSSNSPPTSVIIVGPPQLLLFRQLISETDKVNLSCQTPQSPLVSQCFLSVGGKSLSVVMPSCQLQSTGKDLIHWSGVRPPAQISLSCYYTVATTPQLSSDPSQPVSITVGVQKSTSTNATDSASVTVVGSGGSWTTVIVIFGVIMLVGGLITSFLCLRTRRYTSKRFQVDASPVRHENHSVASGSTNTAPGVMDDMAMPSTAVDSEMTVGLDPDQDSALYHVYSSISDVPNSSNQKESSYSLIQEHSLLQST